MSLIRWEPFNEMDTLFNRMLRRSTLGLPRLPADAGEMSEWSPSADISETDAEYLIRAALPAVKKEDVKVTVDRGTITIEGERKQQKQEKTERFHRIESLYGNFTRSFSLPEDINVEAIRCEEKDGVLTVHMPKLAAEKVAVKNIKVE
jgi:HSP20 family protein